MCFSFTQDCPLRLDRVKARHKDRSPLCEPCPFYFIINTVNPHRHSRAKKARSSTIDAIRKAVKSAAINDTANKTAVHAATQFKSIAFIPCAPLKIADTYPVGLGHPPQGAVLACVKESLRGVASTSLSCTNPASGARSFGRGESFFPAHFF